MAKNGRLPKPIPIKGIYYARRRVPKDLAPHFSGEFEMRSLQTRDPVEAAASFPSVNNAINAMFASMRLSHGRWPTGTSELRMALNDMFDQHLARLNDIEKRILRFAFDQECPAMGDFDERFDLWPVARRSAFARRLADEASEKAGRAPLPIPVHTELYRLAETKLRSIMRVFHAPIDGRSAGVRKHTPEQSPPDLEITLAGLRANWQASKKRPASTVDELKQTIVDFEMTYGAIPAADVTRDDLDDFKVRLRKLPRNLSRPERKLSLESRIALGVKRRKICAETVGKKIALLKALLSFGHKEHILPANVGTGMVTGPKHRAGKRDQFTQAEVTALFSLPLMLKPGNWRSDRAVSDITRAWLLLFGLTSGPRLKETGQAELIDVICDGQACALEVTDESAGPVEEQDDDEGVAAKSVKTESSRRFLVVHGRLLELGFLNYVAAMKRAGATALFPDLWVSGGPSTKEASRSLNRLIDKSSPISSVCFHSFRHTWLAATDEVEMKERLVRQLSGHAPRDESEKYGRAYLKTMASAADRLKFAMVDWDALITAWSGIDWDAAATELVREAKLKSARLLRKQS